MDKNTVKIGTETISFIQREDDGITLNVSSNKIIIPKADIERFAQEVRRSFSPSPPAGVEQRAKGGITDVKELPAVMLLDSAINSAVHGTPSIYTKPKQLQEVFWEAISQINQHLSIAGSESQGREAGWVSVKDRLPENDENRCCMVCYNQTLSEAVVGIGRAWAWFVDDATDAVGNKISYFKEYYGDDLISNVTHWMPLPPPPTSPK